MKNTKAKIQGILMNSSQKSVIGWAVEEDDFETVAEEIVKNCFIPHVMQWVAVKDHLPEDGGYFICCLENGAVTECQYEIIQNRWWLGLDTEVRKHNKVVYWMKKPEPPCA